MCRLHRWQVAESRAGVRHGALARACDCLGLFPFAAAKLNQDVRDMHGSAIEIIARCTVIFFGLLGGAFGVVFASHWHSLGEYVRSRRSIRENEFKQRLRASVWAFLASGSAFITAAAVAWLFYGLD